MTVQETLPAATRVLEAVEAMPGASTFAVAYRAKLNTPGPMGGSGRAEALGILAVLMREGRVTRELRGEFYHWTAV